MLTLPNILTLSRILAVPILVVPAAGRTGWFDYALAFVLYCLMGITDYFDGYLARAQRHGVAARHLPRSDRRQDHGRGGAS